MAQKTKFFRRRSSLKPVESEKIVPNIQVSISDFSAIEGSNFFQCLKKERRGSHQPGKNDEFTEEEANTARGICQFLGAKGFPDQAISFKVVFDIWNVFPNIQSIHLFIPGRGTAGNESSTSESLGFDDQQCPSCPSAWTQSL